MTNIERFTLNFMPVDAAAELPGLRLQIPTEDKLEGHSVLWRREWDAIEILNELVSEGPTS